MDDLMSDPAFPSDLDGLDTRPGLPGLDDAITVRFPPGLGLIPPPALTRQPRPRRGGELAA